MRLDVSNCEPKSFTQNDCSISVQSVKIPTTEHVEEIIQEAINDYDNNRVFSDSMLIELLGDKIKENLTKLKTELDKEEKREKKANIDSFIDTIKAAYFVPHQGLTKVIWKDGTQTEVRCQDGDEYNPEAGLAFCIIKYLFGNINYYNEIFKSVLEKSNSVKKDPPVKKKKALPKKKKRLPSREATGFEW